MSLLLVLTSLFCVSLAAPPPPAVVVLEPSGLWHGNDGPWSSFTFRIGSQSQSVFLLPVPYRNAIVVINPEGCPPNPLLGNNCASDRGNTYDRLQSQSWAAVDGSKWEYSESSLSQPTVGRQQKAWRNSSEPTYKPLIDNVGPDVYGVDVIKSPARTRPWTIKDQGIVGVSNMDPFVGTFGLNTNFNGTAKNPTSFFDNARDVSNTKSVAWSYTAGSVAQNAPASLILGGYDASRFDPSTTVSSSMHSDNRTFTIWLGDIAINDAGKDPQASYQPKLIVDLDFTTPYLSLPNEVCRNMEKSLGLTWDNESRLYFVNDTIHNGLVSRNANISFWIYGDIGKHQFVLSYKSLVLTAKPPLVNQTRKYFAVQRSRGSYFLGRAFLQETYMTAVFDHPGGGYFNLSQANLSDRIRPKIVAIKAADKSNGTADTSASTTQDLKTIIPYIVSGIIVLIALSAYLVWAWRTRHFPFAFRKKAPKPAESEPDDMEVPMSAKSELDGTSALAKEKGLYEVEGDRRVAEMHGDPPPPVEMPAWVPPEVDGKPKILD